MCYNDTTMRFLLLALNPIISLREKCPNTEFFSDPYFSEFRLNTGKYGKHRVKSVQIRSFFWSLFAAFRLNTERYSVSFRFPSKCGKKLTSKNFVFGHFSRSVSVSNSNFLTMDMDLQKYWGMLRVSRTAKAEAYSKVCQTSKLQHFSQIFSHFQSCTVLNTPLYVQLHVHALVQIVTNLLWL